MMPLMLRSMLMVTIGPWLPLTGPCRQSVHEWLAAASRVPTQVNVHNRCAAAAPVPVQAAICNPPLSPRFGQGWLGLFMMGPVRHTLPTATLYFMHVAHTIGALVRLPMINRLLQHVPLCATAAPANAPPHVLVHDRLFAAAAAQSYMISHVCLYPPPPPCILNHS